MKQKNLVVALLALVMIVGSVPGAAFAKEDHSGHGEGNRSEFHLAPVSGVTSSRVQHESRVEREAEDGDDDDTVGATSTEHEHGRHHVEDTDLEHVPVTGSSTTPTPRPVPTPVPCVASTSLSIAATVFTNTTVVKIKDGVTRTVFETVATTSSDIVAAVATHLTTATSSDIAAALTVITENRVSTSTDSQIAPDTCTTATSSSTVAHNENIKARIAELQSLIQALLKLLSSRFGQ